MEGYDSEDHRQGEGDVLQEVDGEYLYELLIVQEEDPMRLLPVADAFC